MHLPQRLEPGMREPDSLKVGAVSDTRPTWSMGPGQRLCAGLEAQDHGYRLNTSRCVNYPSGALEAPLRLGVEGLQTALALWSLSLLKGQL